jgi:hypothetical protein
MRHILSMLASLFVTLPVFCSDVTMSGSADAAEFVQDEPVFATLSFSNSSNEEVVLGLGDDGTGALTWKIVDPLGSAQVFSFSDRWDLKQRLGGFTTPQRLTLPRNGTAHHRILLNERGGFALPGKYRVEVAYPARQLSCWFDVAIGPPDGKRLSERCLALAREDGKPVAAQIADYNAFRMVAPKCSLEALAEISGWNTDAASAALLALGKIGGRPASEILIRVLPSTKRHARDAAIGALQLIAHDTPDSQLRDTILKLLASTPSGDPMRDCIDKATLGIEARAPRAAALAIHYEKLTYSQMNERMPISQGEWDLATTIFERCRSTAPPAP